MKNQSAVVGHGRAPWRYLKCDPIDDDDRDDVPLDYCGQGYCENPGIFDADGNKVVGNGEYQVFGEANRAANVRLMLAAPELLEALKLCAAVCARVTLSKSCLISALEAAKTAIEKATIDATRPDSSHPKPPAAS